MTVCPGFTGIYTPWNLTLEECWFTAGHLVPVCWIHLSLFMQASIWLSWCFGQKTQPVSGVWRPFTPCVRWSNPGFALIYSAHLCSSPFCFISSVIIFYQMSLFVFSFSLMPWDLNPQLYALLKLKTLLYVHCLIRNEMFFLWVGFKTGHVFKKSFPCLIQIRSQAQFQDLCQQHVRGEAEGAPRSGCCPSWSLGNYLAVLTNASCCLSLTSHQVQCSFLLIWKIAYKQITTQKL